MAVMLMEMLELANSSHRLSLQTLLNCNATLLRFAFTDAYIGVDCARTVSSARSAADLDAAVINYTRDRFDSLAQTVAELSSQMQNAAVSDAIVAPRFWE